MSANSARQRGRQSQAQGAALERYLVDSAASARVRLRHIPTPTQILRVAPPKAGQPLDPRLVIARLEPAVAVDLIGHLPGGRALYLEAKTTTLDASPRRWTLPDRLRLPDDKHPARGHQGQALEEDARDGAACAVFLRVVGVGARDYLVPVGPAGCALSLAAASWSWEELAPFAVPGHGRWWEVWTGNGGQWWMRPFAGDAGNQDGPSR